MGYSPLVVPWIVPPLKVTSKGCMEYHRPLLRTAVCYCQVSVPHIFWVMNATRSHSFINGKAPGQGTTASNTSAIDVPIGASSPKCDLKDTDGINASLLDVIEPFEVFDVQNLT